MIAKTNVPPRECSAEIGANGRVRCDCLNGMKEIRADIALCHPRMLELMERARHPSPTLPVVE